MPHRLLQELQTGNLAVGTRLTKLASSSGRNVWSTDQLTQQLGLAGGKLWVRPASSTSRAPIHAEDEPIDSANRPNFKMLAVRKRAACVARRTRPAAIASRQATRSYASDHGHGDHHDHHAAPQVEESPGVRCP